MADASWKDGYRRYLDQEQQRRERREQSRRDYEEALTANCVHGPRVRKLAEQDGRPVAMLVCRLENPNCGVSHIPAAIVYRQWRDSQPEAGA